MGCFKTWGFNYSNKTPMIMWTGNYETEEKLLAAIEELRKESADLGHSDICSCELFCHLMNRRISSIKVKMARMIIDITNYELHYIPAIGYSASFKVAGYMRRLA